MIEQVKFWFDSALDDLKEQDSEIIDCCVEITEPNENGERIKKISLTYAFRN